MLRALVLAAAASAGIATGGDAWPGFRGDGTSLTAAGDLPGEWSDDSNLAWTVDLEGYGQSSPVVWKDRVYVTSVEGPNKERIITGAYRLSDGTRLWVDIRESTSPAEAHERMSKAAPTPAANEAGLWVFFESGDLIAFGHDGSERWKRYLPRAGDSWVGNHGLGSSPRLSDGRLFLHAAPFKEGRLFAIDAATGEDLWTRDLPAAPSFSTPIAVSHGGTELLLTTAGGGVVAYDAADGREAFRRPARGGRGYAVPSASHAGGIVVIASGEAGGTHSFHLDSPGDTLWTAGKATTEFSSPLLQDGRAYLVNSVGVLFELDLDTGTELSAQRLPSGCWASPIASGTRLFFFTVDGDTVVLDQSNGQVLSRNRLSTNGRVYGVAAVNASFIIRSGRRLWRISPKP